MNQLNRHIQPEINFVDRIHLIQPELQVLNNGIQVYLLNAAEQDVVRIEFVFRAGSWFEDKKLVAGFTNRMLKEGTRSYSSREIADRIDYCGAHIEVSSDKDMAYVSLYTLNKHLGKTLPLLAEIILNPEFPEEELEILRRNRKQNHLVNNEKVRYVAKRRFNELIFGSGHPYGKVFTEADFDIPSRDDLLQFHRHFYVPEKCRVIISGKIRPDMISLLNVYFGNFAPAEPVAPNGREFTLTAVQRDLHLEKKNAVQTALRIGKMMFNKTHPDYPKIKVVNTILGGYFGSRLMSNIREDKGFTYGIGSALVSYQNAGYFFIASEVGSSVASLAIQEIYGEIGKMQNEKVPARELDLVKNYILGSFLRSIDGAFSLADNLKELIEYGLDYSYFDRFIEVVKTITPEEVLELSQKYLDPSSMSRLTVGKQQT